MRSKQSMTSLLTDMNALSTNASLSVHVSLVCLFLVDAANGAFWQHRLGGKSYPSNLVQMNLLDRAVKMAAEQDEPEEMNFVRKHAREQAEQQVWPLSPLTRSETVRRPLSA